MGQIKYRKDIDGLRTIAVMAVILYHVYSNIFTGGFVGVDIFFVISGYLISKIIFTELNSKNFNLLNFYKKRILRLFPSLILVLISTLIAGYFLLLPSEFKTIVAQSKAGVFFYSNIYYWLESGYFDYFSHAKPLLHLWSLAIEEQFYIFYPLILFFMAKLKFRRTITIFSLIFLSFLCSLYFTNTDPNFAFYCLFTRAWELLTGALVAHFEYKKYFALKSNRFKSILTSLGLSMIILSIFFIDKKMNFPGFVSLLPVLGTLLVIFFSQESCLSNQLLSNPITNFFGKISYPMYLWHWPMVSFLYITNLGKFPAQYGFLVIISTIVLSIFTTRYIENPIRFAPFANDRAKVFGLCTGLLAIIVFGYIGEIFKQAYTSREFLAKDGIRKMFNWPENLRKDKSCPDQFFLNDADYKFCLASKNKKPTIALIGDSHSNHFFWGLRTVFSNTEENIVNIGLSACPPLIGLDVVKKNCLNKVSAIYDYIDKNKTIHTVILSHFSGYFHKGTKLKINTEDKDLTSLYEEKFEVTIERLMKSNRKIIYVIDNPRLKLQPLNCFDIRPVTISKSRIRRNCITKITSIFEREQSYLDVIKELKIKHPLIKFISSYPVFCNDKYCYGSKNNKPLYRDTNHLTIFGSKLFAEFYKEEFQISN